MTTLTTPNLEKWKTALEKAGKELLSNLLNNKEPLQTTIKVNLTLPVVLYNALCVACEGNWGLIDTILSQMASYGLQQSFQGQLAISKDYNPKRIDNPLELLKAQGLNTSDLETKLKQIQDLLKSATETQETFENAVSNLGETLGPTNYKNPK